MFDNNKNLPNDFIADEFGDFVYKKCDDLDLGTVYCFGGWNDQEFPSIRCFKYNVAKNTWKEIQNIPSTLYDFNLITFSNRYIKLINNGRSEEQTGHWLYDYKVDTWQKIQIQPESCVIMA